MILAFSQSGFAQRIPDSIRLVQFSGVVLDGSNDELLPVPYTNVIVKDKGRGTFTDFKGFFSIVAAKGDVIQFSAIGYKTVEVMIPDSLRDSRYSLVQLMTQDTFNLPETVVFPWPSREHFKLEFLAMDVTQELEEIARENLAQEVLENGRSKVRVDANESADIYLRQQASNYYYYGQRPPMNIFNPIAWKKFFDAWKRGDYKNKDKKEN
ncbi:MAG: carboxypeptidase-like regulatory domain-containing protein [Saprospiraceae bacterium]|nr:carboxypeptidase-like regulatory domain-containing protein [Saprospiraceae bacterium]